jgi:glycosyltransferase involved in cell wall biosynthesis
MRIQPMVSLIQPLHNQQAWLTWQSEALLEELEAWERRFSLVFVDDGSQDGTPELLDELRRRFPQVRVHRHPRTLGVEACIESGIAKAEGEVLLVRDSYLGVSRGLLGRLWPMIDDPQVVAAQCRQRTWSWEPASQPEGESAATRNHADPSQAGVFRMLNWLGWGLPAATSDASSDATMAGSGNDRRLIRHDAAEESSGLRLLRRPARSDEVGQQPLPAIGGLVWEHAADRKLSIRTDRPNRSVPSPVLNAPKATNVWQ